MRSGGEGDMKLSCAECRYFKHKFTDKAGVKAGMCRAWGFSINEYDRRGCKRFEADGERASAEGVEGGERLR